MGLYKETNEFTQEKAYAFGLYLASDLYCTYIHTYIHTYI